MSFFFFFDFFSTIRKLLFFFLFSQPPASLSPLQLTVKGDHRNLVSARVRLLQERQGGPLGARHPVERHRPRGVDDKEHEGAGLAGEALGAHVPSLDVDLPGPARSRRLRGLGARAPGLLVGGRGAQGGVHGQAADLVALGEHRLDVPPAVLGEDQGLGAAGAAQGALLLLGKGEDAGVDDGAVGVDDKLLGDLVGLLLKKFCVCVCVCFWKKFWIFFF